MADVGAITYELAKIAPHVSVSEHEDGLFLAFHLRDKPYGPASQDNRWIAFGVSAAGLDTVDIESVLRGWEAETQARRIIE